MADFSIYCVDMREMNRMAILQGHDDSVSGSTRNTSNIAKAIAPGPPSNLAIQGDGFVATSEETMSRMMTYMRD